MGFGSAMILSDRTVRKLLAEGRLELDPIEDDQIQPASVDVRLGREIRVFRNHTAEYIDPYERPHRPHRAGPDRRGIAVRPASR